MTLTSLGDDLLGVIVGFVHPSELYTLSFVERRLCVVVCARLKKLETLRHAPFLNKPDDILDRCGEDTYLFLISVMPTLQDLQNLKVAVTHGGLLKLRSVHLGCNQIGDYGILPLAECLVSLQDLVILHLMSNAIGPRGITSLCKSRMPHVEALSLGFNRVGDEGLSILADACVQGMLPKCRFLSLQQNDIHDTGFMALSRAYGNGALPCLQELMICANYITKDGLALFAYAYNTKQSTPHLKRINLAYNRIYHMDVVAFSHSGVHDASVTIIV